MCGLKCNYMYLETGPFLLQYLWMMIIMSRTMGHFLQRCLQKKTQTNSISFFVEQKLLPQIVYIDAGHSGWATRLLGLILHGGNIGNCLHAPWSLPWRPWNAPIELYDFLKGCPLPMRKCLGAIVLSKTKHTGLVFNLLTRFESSDEIWVARSITPWVSLECSPF